MKLPTILSALSATVLCLVAQAAGAAGGDSLARVEAYLGSLETLSAEFVQVVRDRDGQVTERATGTFSLSRPDRFRWDYRDPYVQTIVADGRKLWLYDSDLEQVTVRTLEAGLGTTPATLLSGSGKVGDSFVAGPVEREGALTWCRLQPKSATSDFERVSLAFDDRGELAAMQLLDKLGQGTEIEFGKLRRNPVLDEKLFRFVPPKGADVIGQATP